MYLKPDYKLKKNIIIVSLFLFLYGIIIEVLQSKITLNRVGEYQDILANVLGIFLGALIFRYIRKLELNYNKGLFF